MDRFLNAELMHVYDEDLKRLGGWKNLTYIVDGWEDLQQWSIYGSMISEVSQFPVVLGLEELTGKRATANQLVELSDRALLKKEVKPEFLVAVCTDNPTTMRAFRRKWSDIYPWLLVRTSILI